MTTYLLAILLASLASVVLQACGGGSGSACANAAAQFEANPNDGTASIVRNVCGME